MSEGDVCFFGIRHHSPRCSLELEALICSTRPARVLVEAPSDAQALLTDLLAPDTEPPVAILAYTPDSEVVQLYPYCSYSPELVALKTASELGLEARLIDLPASMSMGLPSAEEPTSDGPKQQSSGYDLVARATGHASFDEMWETLFEIRRPVSTRFVAELRLFGDTVRLANDGADESVAIREAFMRREIKRAVKEVGPDQVLVVCGAAHILELCDLQLRKAVPKLRKARGTKLLLIPFSYPRLSEMMGYGAGNRAPFYYQKVWEHRGDFQQACLELLSMLARQLRERGDCASLADSIEAAQLCCRLARLREKEGPGLDELTDAAIACFGRGNDEIVLENLTQIAVGSCIGKLSARTDLTKLQLEFYDEAKRLGLRLTDEPKNVELFLANPTDRERSVFLHRTRVAEIDFAGQVEAASSTVNQLTAVKERWTVCWSPTTDMTLIERSVQGNAFQEVCAKALLGELDQAASMDRASEILLNMALTDLPDLYPRALSVCDSLCELEEDFCQLAVACHHLNVLDRYGATRKVSGELFAELLQKLYLRAVLNCPYGLTCNDERAAQLCDALKQLYEVMNSQPLLEDELFVSMLREVVENRDAQSLVVGLAASLLNLMEQIERERLGDLLSFHLSTARDPVQSAYFLEGFLSLNSFVMVKDRDFVQLVSQFVCAIDQEHFRSALPILRRVFGGLSAREKRYIASLVLDGLGVAPSQLSSVVEQPVSVDELSALDQRAAQELEVWMGAAANGH